MPLSAQVLGYLQLHERLGQHPHALAGMRARRVEHQDPVGGLLEEHVVSWDARSDGRVYSTAKD